MATAAVAKTARTAKAAPELPRITGSGMRQLVAGGPTVRAFWVASQSHQGLEHTVYVFGDGRLSCDCPSSHFRGYCAHRDAVKRALAEEAATVVRVQAQAEEAAACGWRLTAKGRAYLEQMRREEEAEKGHPGDTAPLRRRKFSLMA